MAVKALTLRELLHCSTGGFKRRFVESDHGGVAHEGFNTEGPAESCGPAGRKGVIRSC